MTWPYGHLVSKKLLNNKSKATLILRLSAREVQMKSWDDIKNKNLPVNYKSKFMTNGQYFKDQDDCLNKRMTTICFRL